MKMGRRRRCSSVTDRLRHAPSFVPVRLGPPCRRPILIATKYLVFRGQDTRAKMERRRSLAAGASEPDKQTPGLPYRIVQ
jgi:hypothetical protein